MPMQLNARIRRKMAPTIMFFNYSPGFWNKFYIQPKPGSECTFCQPDLVQRGRPIGRCLKLTVGEVHSDPGFLNTPAPPNDAAAASAATVASRTAAPPTTDRPPRHRDGTTAICGGSGTSHRPAIAARRTSYRPNGRTPRRAGPGRARVATRPGARLTWCVVAPVGGAPLAPTRCSYLHSTLPDRRQRHASKMALAPYPIQDSARVNRYFCDYSSLNRRNLDRKR